MKVCCGFLSPFKDPPPLPGLNLRPLGPVSSTLTTTPPRRLYVALEICIYHFPHACYASRQSFGTDLIVHAMHDEWWGQTYEECGETRKTGTTRKICLFKSTSLNSVSLQSDAAQCCDIMHLAVSREMLPVGVLVLSLSLRVSISYKSRRHSSIIHTSTLILYVYIS
jgi:hypothetical protein